MSETPPSRIEDRRDQLDFFGYKRPAAGSASFLSSDMTWEAFGRLPKKQRDHFYRCPGCGEMVDKRGMDEMKVHHEHVLHPTRGGLPRQQQDATFAASLSEGRASARP